MLCRSEKLKVNVNTDSLLSGFSQQLDHASKDINKLVNVILNDALVTLKWAKLLSTLLLQDLDKVFAEDLLQFRDLKSSAEKDYPPTNLV